MAFSKTAVSMILISGMIFCGSVSAIEDLGTVYYNDIQPLAEEIDGEVNLTFICSTINESYDESCLKVDRYYDSFIDNTTYYFRSNLIDFKWWMNFSTVTFFYRDTNSSEIFTVTIDYGEVLDFIPPNPWEIELEELLNVSADLDSLTTTYNVLKTNYDTAIQNLILKRSELNATTQEYNDLSVEITNLTEELANETYWRIHYNNLSVGYGVNLNLFRGFYDDMNSNVGLFSFKDPETVGSEKRYYMPKSTTDSKIENMQSQLDIGWLWVVLAVLFTSVIVILLVKLTSSKRGATSADLAFSGYTKDMWDVDRLGMKNHGIKDKIKNKLKTKKKTESTDQDDMEKRMKEIEESSKKTEKLTTELSNNINLLLAKLEPKKTVKT